jgi:signal peptidase II
MARGALVRVGGHGLVGWLLIALVIVVLDQFTKTLIIGWFQYGDSRHVSSFFNLVRVHNTGAAFSFLAGAAGWQRWFFTALGIAAAVFIVWLLRSHGHQRLFGWALTLILGGAIGNVIDRLLHGYVVDFLDFHWGTRHFPAFNLADSAITLGALLLILDELRRVRRG